jgi:hypothetical protein
MAVPREQLSQLQKTLSGGTGIRKGVGPTKGFSEEGHEQWV